MKRFLLLWCTYDCDNYRGHRIEPISAESLAEAKIAAKTFLDERWVRQLFEFRLVELGEHDSNYRLWDTRAEPNEGEVAYTIKNYWESQP